MPSVSGAISAAVSTALGASPPVKGWISVIGRPDLKITFQYNPDSVSEAVSLDSPKGHPQKPGANRVVTTYHSRKRTYTMSQVTFDTYEMPGSPNVKTMYVDKLMDFMLLDKMTEKTDPNAKQGRPALLTLYLGQSWSANGFLTKCSAKYTLFHSDFTPARAKVDLTFEEAQILFSTDEVQKQNPTSAGLGGETSYVVQPGDTLEGIAFREIGNPTKWRVIAEANGIENPLGLKPGMRLFIPVL